jgi:hypothetical protein
MGMRGESACSGPAALSTKISQEMRQRISGFTPVTAVSWESVTPGYSISHINTLGFQAVLSQW